MPRQPNFHHIDEFDKAAQNALDFLKQTYDLGLWMVTRTVANDWIVLNSISDKYDVKNGDALHWGDSFCYNMVQGRGPNIAPDSNEVEAYVSAPINQRIAIRAYVGYPLTLSDGSLFGTLCAIDPEPQPETLRVNDPLFRQIAEDLSHIMNGELARFDLRRLKSDMAPEQLDDDTGLLNLAGWDAVLDRQREKRRKFGEPSALLEVQLESDGGADNAAEADMKTAIDALDFLDGDHSLVARLDDDRLGILLESEDALDPSGFAVRLRRRLEDVAVAAAVGWACLDGDRSGQA